MDDLLGNLGNPPSSYRSATFWVWNDEMTKEQIKWQLEQLATNGFGGAFIHPRPGLVTEYLSEEWFELWEYAMEEARKLGLFVYIYDENSYPSGFGGGHVPSELPDCIARGIRLSYYENIDNPEKLYEDRWIPEASYKRPLKIYAFSRKGEKIHLIKDVTEIPDAEWSQYGKNFIAVEWVNPHYTPWLGGFAYPDLLRKEVTARFIECTYQAYFDRFKDRFGDTIPAIFTDEPVIAPGSVFVEDSSSLPFSHFFANEFKTRNGYDLIEHIIWLFVDPTEESNKIPSTKVRFDFYCTIRELWIENYIKPISEWCDKSGISWTGHFFEHQWPSPWGQCSPAVMSLYEYMDWPGIDMLMTYLLKDDEFDPLMVTIKEVSSVAHQLNKDKVLCECFGAGGWDATFADLKRITDWLAVHGITFFNQHLTFSTYAGARKRDHPLSFDWREPWWKEYKYLNDYTARLSYVMNNSKSNTRILVLHPTTSWFVKATSSDEGNMLWDWGNIPEDSPFKQYIHFLEMLRKNQIDYDLGDEFILERHQNVKPGVLEVGHAEYDVIIIPKAMRNLRSATFKMLQSFMDSGGKVISMNGPLTLLDGVPSDALLRLKEHPNWFSSSESKLLRLLKQFLFEPIKWEFNGSSFGISHRYKQLSDGTAILFLINSSSESYLVSMEAQADTILHLDLFTGEYHELELKRTENGNTVQIQLPATGSRMLYFKPHKQTYMKLSFTKSMRILKKEDWQELELHNPEIKLLDSNALVLDYCDLTLGGQTYMDINTIAATDKIYRYHGLQGNPWDRTIQYKRRYIDHQSFGKESGFEAKFHFLVKDHGVRNDLRLAVERAEKFELYINGKKINWEPNEYWMDHHIGIANIGEFVKDGINTIRLLARTFHITLELEQIYLLGNFTLSSNTEEFAVTSPKAIKTGSLVDQGYPFYPGGVHYRYNITFNEEPLEAQLMIENWIGTVCRVFANGDNMGLIGVENKDRLKLDNLKCGRNQIEVYLYGSLKNLLGPFHDASKPRNLAWPSHWKIAPIYGRPEPKAYDLIHYGINDPVKIIYRI